MNPERPLTNALILVLAGAALGIGSNVLHPDPISWTPEKRPPMTVLEDPGSASDDPAGTGATAAPGEPGAPAFKPMKDGFGRAEAVPKTDLYADVPGSEYPVEVRIAKAKQLYDRGGLLVLDSREHAEYVEGHIKGAVLADADKVVADLEWMETTAADPRPILVYCDGGDCELSLDLGFEIARAGHRKVLVFVDGYPAWEEAGYPVATGDTP